MFARLGLWLVFGLLLIFVNDFQGPVLLVETVTADSWECWEQTTYKDSDGLDFEVPTGSPLDCGEGDCIPSLTGTPTDFSVDCASDATDCGSVCFYAECLDCADGEHQHCDPEVCWDTNCTGEGDDEVCDEECSQNCWMEWHGIPSCVNWLWHLYGEPVDNYRAESFSSPNIGAALSFGAFSDLAAVTGGFSCQVADRSSPESLASIEPRHTGGPPFEADWEWGYADDVPLGLSDYPDLVVVPGEPGAPSLDSVVKVTDRVVTLNTSGYGTNAFQYRYWFYNGLVPPEIRVPFQDLIGNVAIGQSRGAHAFQVRAVYSDGTFSGRSNVVYEVLGFEGWAAARAPGPLPPVLSDILYVVPDGVVRPSKPFIRSLVQEPVVADSVRVTVYGNYSGVQYRWWPHNGKGPHVSSVHHAWKPVALDSSYGFLVREVKFLPLVSRNTVSIGSPSPGLLRYFDFQIRLVEYHVVDGESVFVESEHSNVVVVQVWGGPNWEW